MELNIRLSGEMNGALGSLQYDTFNQALNISATDIAPVKNCWIASMVVASGASTARIDLTGNWWGTLDTSVIQSRITDNASNKNLPTVNYNLSSSQYLTGNPVLPDLST